MSLIYPFFKVYWLTLEVIYDRLTLSSCESKTSMIYDANILLIICKSRKRYECSISYCNNIECERLIFGFQRSKKANIITLDICSLNKASQNLALVSGVFMKLCPNLCEYIAYNGFLNPQSGFLQPFSRVFCLMILMVSKQIILNNKMLHVRSRRTKSQSYYMRHHYEGFTLFPKQLTHSIMNVHISLSTYKLTCSTCTRCLFKEFIMQPPCCLPST